MDATWLDNCGVSSNGATSEAKMISNVLNENPSHNIFGSVAFKYQTKENNPAFAAHLATQLGFIPVTSGDTTGKAPTIEKIQNMFKQNPHCKLGLASGVTPDNISSFLPYVSHFLISTGISSDYYNFDELLVRQIKERINT